jgi:hypothetical protein
MDTSTPWTPISPINRFTETELKSKKGLITMWTIGFGLILPIAVIMFFSPRLSPSGRARSRKHAFAGTALLAALFASRHGLVSLTRAVSKAARMATGTGHTRFNPAPIACQAEPSMLIRLLVKVLWLEAFVIAFPFWSVTNRLARGKFAAIFFLASLAEIGCETVRLEDV